MPGAQGDYFSRLQNEMDAAGKATAALNVAQQRRDAIQRQLHGEQPLLSSGTSQFSPGGSGSETAVRIRDTRARLDELLLRFTDKHPDVIALQATLVDLQARQQVELEGARKGDSGAAANSGLSANPVYQSIQLQSNQVDVEIAALRAELTDRQNRIGELRKLVNTAPEVEAEFSRLNRDYDVTRAQYQALVERLEKAKFSDEADQTGVVRFEVMDPPTADFKPVSPNRRMLIIGVLVAGLAAGGALAYLLHQIKPVFSTGRQLAAITGFPVLGEVSRTWFEKYGQLRRRSVLVYAGAIGALALVAVTVLVMHGRAVEILRGLTA
jgi:polysaccharide chain length determinant protein (PEP-CTERM system associated)